MCVYGCRKQQLYPEFFDLFAVVLLINLSVVDLNAIFMNLLHNLWGMEGERQKREDEEGGDVVGERE